MTARVVALAVVGREMLAVAAPVRMLRVRVRVSVPISVAVAVVRVSVRMPLGALRPTRRGVA
jgi:hypothetical protein